MLGKRKDGNRAVVYDFKPFFWRVRRGDEDWEELRRRKVEKGKKSQVRKARGTR